MMYKIKDCYINFRNVTYIREVFDTDEDFQCIFTELNLDKESNVRYIIIDNKKYIFESSIKGKEDFKTFYKNFIKYCRINICFVEKSDYLSFDLKKDEYVFFKKFIEDVKNDSI